MVGQQAQPIADQRKVVLPAIGDAQLGRHVFQISAFKQGREAVQPLLGGGHRAVLIAVQQRHQRLRQAGEVPLRDPRLIDIGVTTALIDRTEYRFRVEVVHEGARAIIDGLAGNRHVVGVHHAMDKADRHPFGEQRRLARDHAVEQRAIGRGAIGGGGIVAGDHMVGQVAERVEILARGEELKSTDADVAAGDPRQYRAGQGALAKHFFAGGDGGQRPGGWHAEGGHRLADDEFT